MLMICGMSTLKIVKAFMDLCLLLRGLAQSLNGPRRPPGFKEVLGYLYDTIIYMYVHAYILHVYVSSKL